MRNTKSDSALLDLFDERRSEVNRARVYRSPVVTREMQIAGRRHALANKSDPFAYKRAVSHMVLGILSPHEIA